MTNKSKKPTKGQTTKNFGNTAPKSGKFICYTEYLEENNNKMKKLLGKSLAEKLENACAEIFGNGGFDHFLTKDKASDLNSYLMQNETHIYSKTLASGDIRWYIPEDHFIEISQTCYSIEEIQEIFEPAIKKATGLFLGAVLGPVVRLMSTPEGMTKHMQSVLNECKKYNHSDKWDTVNVESYDISSITTTIKQRRAAHN